MKYRLINNGFGFGCVRINHEGELFVLQRIYITFSFYLLTTVRVEKSRD